MTHTTLKTLFLLICLNSICSNALFDVPHIARLPEPALQQYLNYPVETHKITTSDGYILTFFRMQAKNTKIQQQGLPAVMLIHGTLDSSDAFLMNEENIAPGFFFANNGYDVWLGNNRGNYYSNEHISLDSKSKEFWDFSLDQMALLDLPAAFEYISNVTQQEKINYIGHSQGTQIMFAALSLDISSVKKHLRTFIGLAPAVFSLDSNTTSNKIQAYLLSKVQEIAYFFKKYEFLPRYEAIIEFGPIACKIAPELCAKLLSGITDYNTTLDNPQIYDVLAGHDPSGTSYNNMQQNFFQGEEFAFFDYGSEQENMQHYQQTTPPIYNLSNVDSNLFLFIGDSDKLVLKSDWLHLINKLNNVPKLFWKVYPAGHCTWIWGYKEFVQPYLNDILEIFKNPSNPSIQFNIDQHLI